MAPNLDRQVAELQVRFTILNRYTALGIPGTETVRQVRLEKGEPRKSTDLCNKAKSNREISAALNQGRIFQILQDRSDPLPKCRHAAREFGRADGRICLDGGDQT